MILDQFRLDDKVAVVSAASRGIGAAIAETLASAGADLVIGARSAEALAEVAEAARAHGRQIEVVAGDLTTREGMAALVDAAADRFGRIDVVVNNAGGTAPSAFLDTTEEAFDQAFRWNVTTAFNLTQLATPLLLESGAGSVVNIASAAARNRSRGFVAYGTAKAAMVKMTRHMASDLAPKVRVNAISPGAIRTDALAGILDAQLEAAMVEGTPMRRLGEVDDIAAAALYLSSPASSYVTGAVLDVTGGIESSNLEMPIPDL